MNHVERGLMKCPERGAAMQGRIKAVLIDFGGVIADEGFRDGLHAIARQQKLDPGPFFAIVDSLIDETGYLTGMSDEPAFWNAVRARTGIIAGDGALRREILSRFVIRQEMLAVIDRIRSRGISVAMLSDQTDWLEEIDKETGLFRHFDRVFNSFRMHKSKRDASLFRDVCAIIQTAPEQTLFVDDNIDHIKRASKEGLHTIHFVSVNDFIGRLEGSMT